MNEKNLDSSLSSDELWLKIINEGKENRVEVNQRMLIDKMLARYSSEFVVYRELIQNSDDAQATSFTLEITCDPSTATINYESVNKDDLSVNQRKRTNILGGIGQLLKNHWKSDPTSPNKDTTDSSLNSQRSLENDFNNCIITQIRTINNGNIFTEDDWTRVITIAEGNTNVDAIGQFGVGFFSVFSYSERPMIQSGKHGLAFSWQNGKSLTTFRKELSNDEQASTTSIILKMKNKFILETKSSLEINEINDDVHRPTKSKKNTMTNEIVPTMDLTQLKAYFTKVLSFTKFIDELIIKINGHIVFQVNKTKKSLVSTKLSLAAKRINKNTEHNLLRFNSFNQTEQEFSIQNGPSITLNHIDVQAQLTIDKEFHEQIRNVLKKSLPSTVHIQFLFPSNNILLQQQWKTLNNNNLNNQILKELIPLKFHNQEIVPAGQIFIGLATHQSTGIGMHLFSHLIPTIERENIDLQDPYISIWNEQLLVSIGKIIRFIYDQIILDAVNNIHQDVNQQLNLILSPYAFQPSAPNKDIGRILLDGFFSSQEDILVPVKRCPSDNHLSLIPSTEAFLSNSKHIQAFLPVPLVPFEISKNNFFKILKERRWIEEIDYDTIVVKIHQSIFLFSEFVELLRWLCKNDMNNSKVYIKRVLSKIHYRDTRQSPIIKLENIELYDALNINSLPLPPNVLPPDVVAHISREDLQRRLSLSAMSAKTLIEYYLIENQHHLFHNENTSKILLSFICQNWNQFNDAESTIIRSLLSSMKCIPTSQGMKSPNESYIRSSNLSSDLPIITLYIPQVAKDNNQQESKDHPVSTEFLKSIGCRTIHVPTLTNPLQTESNDLQKLETVIQDLLKQRRNMSDTDLHALKHNQCITGTTLESNGQTKTKYKPCDLHFPSVAIRLKWNELPIIDWLDIDSHSQEYSFLKELGVKEVPELHKLIARIDFEHQAGSKQIVDYKLPNSLVFFAEKFQVHYSKLWKNAKIRTPFLPSSVPDVNHSTEVILTTPETAFKELSPLFPSLLPDVIRCFSQYFNMELLGVKNHPTLPMAFEVLMEKRNQLLTFQTASKYFAYFNKLDGLNTKFIQRISTIPFIPLSENKFYAKISQVFIPTKISTTSQDNNTNTLDDIAARGLIDYIDYGSDANSFLLNIGVLPYPSAENLADLLIERQESYFNQNKNDTEELISAKVRFYTNCLKQLSAASNVTQQLYVEPLRSRLINKPWCLAYQSLERSDGTKHQIFKTAKPSDIYLDDDHQSAIDLRPLCAPDEPELMKLYKKFGAKWISECVKRTLVHRGKCVVTDRSKKLGDRIHHRLDMLFVNNRGESMENIDENRIELLRKHFVIYEAEGIECQLTFQNRTITLNSTECSSCALEFDRKQVCLYIHKDISTLDYIDIATELTRFVCKKPLDTLVHSISDKLSSPLGTLKRRGIPVDRLLKSSEQQPVKLSLQIEPKKLEETKPKPALQQQEQIMEPKKLEENKPKSASQQQEQIMEPKKLLQQQEQQQLQRQHQQGSQEQYQQNILNQRGLFQSLKDLLAPMQLSTPSAALPPPPPTATNPKAGSVENISSTIERTPIENFGQFKSEDDADIEKMIRTSRPYSQMEFNQREHSKTENNSSCEYVPATNMIRYDKLLHGIPLYIDRNVKLTNIMIEQGKQLAWVLASLAQQVFNVPVQTMHLFRDIDSARIAFNTNGALFFNLRYFEQVFFDDLRYYLENSTPSLPSSTPIVRKIANFYYMIACHELSHNIDSNHDLHFIDCFEKVSVRFMDAKDAFLSTFSLQF
ncbi:unnamed protein product [Rotaria socialis]|uniref:Uncharacterized protein n=1 Tax=Rotaria socialis TaxID=392032 RepID=A0A820LTT8_9BILA|nr:unnamed protein product [Rotaria socialis]CAF3624039.1 unnamed protein product [Rotaria socialis]CAF4206847.1 unnamed protein product [Rotaria socialis]CAF4362782.1 unnamed protein product [Rotaria socialis]